MFIKIFILINGGPGSGTGMTGVLFFMGLQTPILSVIINLSKKFIFINNIKRI